MNFRFVCICATLISPYPANVTPDTIPIPTLCNKPQSSPHPTEIRLFFVSVSLHPGWAGAPGLGCWQVRAD